MTHVGRRTEKHSCELRNLEDAPADFHARFSASGKTYARDSDDKTIAFLSRGPFRVLSGFMAVQKQARCCFKNVIPLAWCVCSPEQAQWKIGHWVENEVPVRVTEWQCLVGTKRFGVGAGLVARLVSPNGNALLRSIACTTARIRRIPWRGERSARWSEGSKYG